MNNISIVERINTRLAEKGWSGYDLAKQSGISSSTVYRILNKEVQPRNDTVDKLFETLGMPK